MNTIYFQPPGIKKEYCEIGMISEGDPDYIWYLNEPCKILISEVKIINEENVIYNKKSRIHEIKKTMKPIHKLNNGLGATLCHKCSVIISTGLTKDLYCEKCISPNTFVLPKVRRVEVIQHSEPHNGRAYTNYNAKDVELQYQDDGKTLKIFLK